MTRTTTLTWLTLAALVFGAVTGCAPEERDSTTDGAEVAAAEPLVVYSGRNKSLIGPLLERFTAAQVEVRYGGTAELAATLMEEGGGSPCDVFIAQDAAALGALSAAGHLQPLPADVLERIASRFASPAGDWVGLSGRARTVVYNPERIRPEDLPQSLEAAADARYRGRWGVAPVNASFQAHMAVYHAVHGRPALDQLLAGMAANEPQRYPKNSPIVEAVLQGEIDWGLVNHYYLLRALAEDPEAAARGANFVMPEGEASRFLNLAGAAMVSERPEAAELVRYLLSEEAQRYFAEETFEYPLAAGVQPSAEMPALAEAAAGQVDFARVSEVLESTLEAISASGLLIE